MLLQTTCTILLAMFSSEDRKSFRSHERVKNAQLPIQAGPGIFIIMHWRSQSMYVSSPLLLPLLVPITSGIRTVINWFLVTDPLSFQIMNRCNKPTPHHVFFLSHNTSSGLPHCAVTYSQTCITRINCCCWLVSISSTSMFLSSPHTSALAGAGQWWGGQRGTSDFHNYCIMYSS